MGLIYMRTSPSGGRYIGKTIKKEQDRWSDHIYEAYNKKSSCYDTLLSRAIRKYGEENFIVEILEDNIIDEEQLKEREKYWIAYYKTFYKDNCHGYNMTLGGDGNARHHISEFLPYWDQGYSVIEISRILNVRRQTVADFLHDYGISKDEIIKRGIIAQRKTSFKFDLEETYKLWSEGKSIFEIKQHFDLDPSNDRVSKALQEFYGVTQEEINKRGHKYAGKKKRKPVYQYDLNNNLIKCWNCIDDAAEALHTTSTSIYNNLKGVTKNLQHKYIFSRELKEKNND